MPRPDVRNPLTVFSTIVICVLISSLSVTPSIYAAADDPAWGTSGIVSSAHPIATEVGAGILEEGGNAIDAAIALSYALNVVEGYSAGIGGGEFWVIRWAKNGEVICIDGRETAPASAHRDMYLDSLGNPQPELSYTGILAGGIPGSVAAREKARELYATMSRKKLLKPGIDLAEKGFIVSPSQAEYYEYLAPKLEKFPTTKAILFRDDSTTWQAGDRLIQKDLAATYKRLSKFGNDDFYHGATAKEIARFMKEHGGLITLKDLEEYEVLIRKPVSGTYRGYDIYSMPPPSSGGIHLIQMLNILEGWDLQQFGRYSARYYHHLASAMEAAFADRAEYLGDPAFYDVPVEGLISKEYADELRGKINSIWHTNVKGPGNPFVYMESDSLKPGHTTHFSVMDKWGNMVAVTSTINTGFGSGVVLGNTGIFLNNEMDDFSIAPGQPNYFGLIGKEANAIAPGKRPLSSMSPTLILKDGKPFMSVGGAGGPKIITGTLQTILNVIDFETDIQDAIADPRIHHQWAPGYLYVDKEISPDCLFKLFTMGHKISLRRPGSSIQGVLLDSEQNLFFGGWDPRGGGAAKGITIQH